jgi:hypothetical protein
VAKERSNLEQMIRLMDIEKYRHKNKDYGYIASDIKQLGLLHTTRLTQEEYSYLKSKSECKKLGYIVNDESLVGGFVRGKNGYYPVFDIRIMEKKKTSVSLKEGEFLD